MKEQKQERRKGREYVDPTPVEWPIGLSVPESLEQKIARMVRTSVSSFAASQGAETFDEADDFDVEDDPNYTPESRHELDDDQVAIMRDQEAIRRIPKQFREAFERELERRRAQAERDLAPPRDPEATLPPASTKPEDPVK